jgi:LysM repeat protein
MAISPKRAAAVVMCAVCAAAAAPGLIGRTAIQPGPDMPSAAGRMISPTIEPAAVSASIGPAPVMHLQVSDLPRDPDALVRLAGAHRQERSPRSDAATHTVVAGDTLWAIAQSGRVSVDALAAANSLPETAVLRVGRVLTIPAAGTNVPASAGHAAAIRSRPAHAPQPAAAPPAPQTTAARVVTLLWPSRGIVTSRFGWRVHPIFGGREFHTGVDIGARLGTPVVAARAGVVHFVGWKTGYGRIIIVEHDGGLETSYSHLSAALVSPGDHVTQGQVIGRIGNTGWSTGPHLLFEVRRNGVPVDPASYLN